MPATVTGSGSLFANAVADSAGLPPDNSPPGTAPTPPAEEKPPVEAPPEKKEEKPPVEKAADIITPPEKKDEKPADDLSDENPHLAAELEQKSPAEVKPEVVEEMPPGMTKKAQESWKSIKAAEKAAAAERDTIRAEAETLRTQLMEAGKTGPEIEALKKELEDTRARLTEYEGEIYLSRIESTPRFKNEVTGPIESVNKTIQALATKYEMPMSTIMDAIREPDPAKRADAIQEVIGDFKAYDQSEVIEAARTHTRATELAEKLRADSKGQLEQVQKEEQTAFEGALAKNSDDYKKAVGAIWKEIQAQNPLLQPIDGKPRWNDYLSSIPRDIEAINVNSIPVEDIARMAVRDRALKEVSKSLDYFQKQAKSLAEERDALKKRLEGYREITPGAGVGRTENGAPAATTRRSFVDAVAGDDE